jgi:heme/copper-type cytochrome/quinol oxidase subunit 3
VTVAVATMRRRRPPVAIEPPRPIVSNARLAAVLIIVGESMLFAGLIGMYLVFRLSTETWPPPELPRLPVLVTALNTLVLFASVVPMHRAFQAVRRDDLVAATRLAAVTGLLGLVFLSVQGFEWVRLVRHGLTLQKGQYGGAFYVLIGCHALHVFVAVLWVVAITVLAERRRFSAARHDGFEMCTIFWYFVSALWAGLFPLVYLY